MKNLALALIVAIVPLGLLGISEPKANEPNIIFILIDDLGWTDVGPFGARFYETPHIDRLAREGMVFTNAYAAASICSPTRASILTGKHPARLDQTDWIPGRRDRTDQRMLTVQDLNYLDQSHQTVADVLKASGYKTAHIGKWHLGPNDGYLPETRGFDVNIAGNQFGSPPGYFYPYARSNGYELKGLQADGKEGEYLTDRLGREAASFIKDNRDGKFFMHFSQYAVHTPLQAPTDLREKYEARVRQLPDRAEFGLEGERPVRRIKNHAVYAAMVESMDRSVGMILDALDEAGIADNTLIVFFSDNGGLSTSEGWPTSNLPLRGGKGWLYEGGIRVPMIARWPATIEAGRSTDVPVISTDFMTTLSDVAGVETATEDGTNLGPLFSGDATLPERNLYWHYPHYSNQGSGPAGAVRKGPWKLIEYYEDGRTELFNLENDLGEKVDLSREQPEVRRELAADLSAWRTSLDARMPAPNPDFKE